MKTILAKLFFCPEDMVHNVGIHIPLGIINVLLCLSCGFVGLLFGIGFVVYELNQQKSIQDMAFQDIKGWLWGLAAAGMIVWIAGAT